MEVAVAQGEAVLELEQFVGPGPDREVLFVVDSVVGDMGVAGQLLAANGLCKACGVECA